MDICHGPCRRQQNYRLYFSPFSKLLLTLSWHGSCKLSREHTYYEIGLHLLHPNIFTPRFAILQVNLTMEKNQGNLHIWFWSQLKSQNLNAWYKATKEWMHVTALPQSHRPQHYSCSIYTDPPSVSLILQMQC